jgi:predicted small lipoprotein YifL
MISKRNITAYLCLISVLTACNTEGPIKLNTDDRNTIDTVSSKKISAISLEMDQWCKDSAPIFKQKIIDSLMLVREQEILKQAQPLPVQ